MKNAEEYADIIIRDEREKIVSEKPTVYTDDKIERVYEFGDGAVVKYEWQSSPMGRTSADGRYNHKFSLTKLPSPNPNKFKTGVVKVINYPE
jgi:phage baseplate assembly protein gpV